ncbi:high-affinity nitrate transporter 3.1-like [Punica granatum]|uniref:High-affinity nitrate transporter n=2 Tax=Punica granatum TaxID=22663 RepID=A0A218VZA9_PUNGR|nr:high-affinity nitrate transporter 3.1-like [Punica granatum]OWM65400.1 hypothetical protein CDL15_Pgr008990 [Punica granatum]PKI38643.1 hypothetical protein CRG98_040977 [Punica granatum]
MAAPAIILATLLVACLTQACHGNVLFSSLKRTLVVTATPKAGEVLKGGEDKVTVTWSLNGTYKGQDSEYKTVKVKLCYSPISQKDRGWRKTEDELHKDKTCQFTIVSRPYSASAPKGNFTWTIEKDIPQATYFIRAYALNAKDDQVAYGQTTNTGKTTNLFTVNAVTGRHVSLDIASVCFSAFSVVSLAFFFAIEKRKAKKSSPPPPQM